MVTPTDQRPTRADLARLVDCFYERVQSHPELGPIFNAAVSDWPEHKALLTSFWASVVLGEGSFRGNPMAVHRALPVIRAHHFDQWLLLWQQTTGEVLEADAASYMQTLANRIGHHLSRGVAAVRPEFATNDGPDVQAGASRA